MGCLTQNWFMQQHLRCGERTAAEQPHQHYTFCRQPLCPPLPVLLQKPIFALAGLVMLRSTLAQVVAIKAENSGLACLERETCC